MYFHIHTFRFGCFLQEGFAIEDDFGATDDFTREDDIEEEFQRARRQAEEENERQQAAENAPAPIGVAEVKAQNGRGDPLDSLLSTPYLSQGPETVSSHGGS